MDLEPRNTIILEKSLRFVSETGIISTIRSPFPLAVKNQFYYICLPCFIKNPPSILPRHTSVVFTILTGFFFLVKNSSKAENEIPLSFSVVILIEK